MWDLEAFVDAVNAGAPTPAVEPAGLKRVWQFMQSLSADRQQDESGCVGVDSIRWAVLEILFRHGVLKQWQTGGELHGAVFRVAATIPLSRVRVDPDTFIDRLRGEAE